MEACVGATGFFFAALVVGVTHFSEIESAAVARPCQKANAASVTITAARKNFRDVLKDFLRVNPRLPTRGR